MGQVTALYVAALTLWLIVLSARVIVSRRTEKILYGDNDMPRVTARIRAQGNLTEYAPFGLILILTLELQGVSAVWLHLLALPFLAGRLIHGYGLSFQPRVMAMRVAGMMLTLVSLAALAVVNIGVALF